MAKLFSEFPSFAMDLMNSGNADFIKLFSDSFDFLRFQHHEILLTFMYLLLTPIQRPPILPLGQYSVRAPKRRREGATAQQRRRARSAERFRQEDTEPQRDKMEIILEYMVKYLTEMVSVLALNFR